MPQNNISLTEAQDWARNFRKNPANKIIGHLIPRANLEQLLACADGVDVRVYFGQDDRGEQKLMFVSVDANGHDLIDENNGYLIYDRTQTSPPCEDPTSPLTIL